jgi:cytoskeletal protein RodZ
MLQELRRVEELIEEGDLVAAQRMCKRLLQQNPTNAAVHERMGDVMRKRELWEDAAEWYDLAAQLHETEAVKAKRAEAQRRAKEARRGGPEPHLVDDADSPRRLLLWIGLAAAALLLVVIGVVFSIATREDETEEPAVARTGDTDGPSVSRPGLSAPSPVRGTRDVPATGADSGTRALPPATSNPEEHWRASQMPRRAPRRSVSTRSTTGISTSSPEPTTDHDQAVIAAVSSLTWGDNRPMSGRVNAMVEPFSGYAMVSVTIPQALPEEGLVENVVRQAWRVALASLQADEVITALTVRMVRVMDDGERVVAFRGNTTRRALQTTGVDRPTFAMLWDELFASVWWNPQAGGDPPVMAEAAEPGSG